MDQREHAQQIFSMMLGGMAGSGTMPSATDAKKWAEMAVLYADAFAKKATEMEMRSAI